MHLGRQQRIETGRSASGQNDAVQTFLQAPIPCLELGLALRPFMFGGSHLLPQTHPTMKSLPGIGSSTAVSVFPRTDISPSDMRIPGYPGFLASPSLWPEDQELALRGTKMDTGRTVLIRTDIQLFGH